MRWDRRRFGVAAAIAACGVSVVLVVSAVAAPTAVPAGETAATDDGPWRRMALPAGNYSSLVLANGGNNANAVIEFQTPSGTFPIVVRPGETLQLDFPDVLRVAASGDYVLDATPGRFTLKSEVIRSGFVSVFATSPGGIVPLTPLR